MSLDFLKAQSDMALAQSRQPMKPITDVKDAKATREAAETFESYFVSQMFQQMYTDISSDGLFGGGHGEEMFRSLLFDEYGKQVAKSGGIGIADHVMQVLIAQQESK